MDDVKLIAVDLDGTLLNNEHKLSEYTLQVWKSLNVHNILLVPVTGRTLQGQHASVPFELCMYSVNTNGVHVYLNNNGVPEIIMDKSLPWDEAHHVLQFLDTEYPDYLVQLFSHDVLYANAVNDLTQEYTRRSGMQHTVVNDWAELKPASISKIMVLGDNSELKLIQKHVSSLNHVHAVFSVPWYLEIFNVHASKGNALLYLCKRLGIDMKRTVGIGDSFNDLAMLDVCGRSFVMKNAHPHVAPELPRTEFDNEQNGAAKLMQSLAGI